MRLACRWEAVLGAVCGHATRATPPAALPASIMTLPRASAYLPLPAMEAAARSASTWTLHANAARPCRIATGDVVHANT